MKMRFKSLRSFEGRSQKVASLKQSTGGGVFPLLEIRCEEAELDSIYLRKPQIGYDFEKSCLN